MTAPTRWYVDAFQDAVWEARGLSVRAKMLALAYARHVRDRAGERTPFADLAWLTYERAMAQTGIGKRSLVTAAAKELEAAGWLVPVRVVTRRPTVYRLTVPGDAGGSHEGTTDPGTTDRPVVPTSEPPLVPTGEPPQPSGSSQTAAGSSLPESGSSHGGTSVVPTWERDFSLKRTTQTSSGRSPTVAYVVEHTDADDDEAAALIEKIKHIPVGGVRKSIGAYVRGMPREDLAELLAELRAAARPAPRTDGTRPADNRPPTRSSWREELDARRPAPCDSAARLSAREAVRQAQARSITRTPSRRDAWAELSALTDVPCPA